MQPLTSADGMRPKWPDGRSMKKVAGSFIKPNDRLTSFERLEIYNRQYWFRLKDCFFEDYPGLQAILGPRRFERLALAYLEECPSRSYTLRNLGRPLVEFLKANPRWTRPLQKLALDMARLEWAHIEAFDKEAQPRLQVDSLLESDPSALRLNLQPHISLLELGHAVDELLVRLKQGDGLRSEASNAKAGKRGAKRAPAGRQLPSRTIYLAVHRSNDTVFYKRLQPAQFRLLTALQAGATLADACETLAQSAQDEMAHVGDWFKTWAALGWFCEME